MLAILKRRENASDSAPPTTTALEAEWNRLNAELIALVAKRDNMDIALQLSGVNEIRQESAVAVERAGEFLEMAKWKRRKFDDIYQDVTDQIPILRAAVEAAKDRLYSALAVEADDAALALQGRHREAVRQIAEGIELLSRGIAAESEVRNDFALRCPRLPRNPRLPNMSAALADLDLRDLTSTASVWSRAVRQLGIL